MTDEQIIEIAKQAGFEELRLPRGTFACTIKEFQAFAQLVRNETLEEAADSLYGNGLEMSLLHDLREEIKGLKS